MANGKNKRRKIDKKKAKKFQSGFGGSGSPGTRSLSQVVDAASEAVTGSRPLGTTPLFKEKKNNESGNNFTD